MIEISVGADITIVVHEVGPLGARKIVCDQFVGLQDENRTVGNGIHPHDRRGANGKEDTAIRYDGIIPVSVGGNGKGIE